MSLTYGFKSHYSHHFNPPVCIYRRINYTGINKPPAMQVEWTDFSVRISCAKHVNIIEAHAMPDHIHMLVEIPPNQRISDFMGYLKGKSTMIIFEVQIWNRHFWCRGYYFSTIGGNKNGIAKYIKEQEQEDMIYDQL